MRGQTDHCTRKVPCDFAILGSGIAGTILGAILAKHGKRVLLLDHASHPRFAIGESLIPSTASRLRAIAFRYDVPEIANISTFPRVLRHVSSSCGVKRNFGFVYHRRGKPCRLSESTQLCSIAPPTGPDSHLFRQDIDSYLLAVAKQYGADIRLETHIKDLVFDQDGVTINTVRGESFHAQYVVDASGYKSVLATKLGLRNVPCRFSTHSRSVFTHMIGVRSWDTCGSSARDHGLISPLCQGTLHHVFEGGWLWVIPFNNHTDTTNQLCSVGLNLDPRIHPRRESHADREFKEFISRFPSVMNQFRNARAMRDWVATDRLQYSSDSVSGNRYCLLPHAAGFVDPLYSGGLQLTVAGIHLLAGKLLRAIDDGQFTKSVIAPYDDWLRANLRHHDRMVACSYSAFGDFELWNAWFRVYVLGSFFETLSGIRAEVKYHQSKDKSEFLALENSPHAGTLGREVEEYMNLFSLAADKVDSFRNGAISARCAAAAIFEMLENAAFAPPQFKLGASNHRYVSPYTALPSLRMVAWGKTKAPQFLRRQFFDFRPLSYAPEFLKCIRDSYSHSTSATRRTIREMLFSWNNDWIGAE